MWAWQVSKLGSKTCRLPSAQRCRMGRMSDPIGPAALSPKEDRAGTMPYGLVDVPAISSVHPRSILAPIANFQVRTLDAFGQRANDMVSSGWHRPHRGESPTTSHAGGKGGGEAVSQLPYMPCTPRSSRRPCSSVLPQTVAWWRPCPARRHRRPPTLRPRSWDQRPRTSTIQVAHALHIPALPFPLQEMCNGGRNLVQLCPASTLEHTDH